jgi:hypothetical protein
MKGDIMKTVEIEAQKSMVAAVAEVERLKKAGYHVSVNFRTHKVYNFEIDFTVMSSQGVPEGAEFTMEPALFTEDDVDIYFSAINSGCDYCGGSVNVFWEDKSWGIFCDDEPFEHADNVNFNYYNMVHNKVTNEWFFGTFLATHLVDVPEPSKVLDYEQCEEIETSLLAA